MPSPDEHTKTSAESGTVSETDAVTDTVSEAESTPQTNDASENGGAAKKETLKGPKEHFYDKIPLSAKQLDIIIVVLIIALIVTFTLGVLVGNDILDFKLPQ